MRISVLFLYLSLGLINDSKGYYNEIDEKVFNGRDARPGQFPYQAFLRSTKENVGEWLCGGALISRRHILTAAHCLQGVTASIVYLGMTDVNSSDTVTYRVSSSQMMIHPNYNPDNITNDLGIIRLPQSVNETYQVQPIKLPLRDWADPTTFDNNFTVLSGFGVTANQEKLPHRYLQYSQVYVMPHGACAADNMNPPITDGMICADRRVKSGHCQGDSGGPLAVNLQSGRYLVGVVSWGYRPCVNSRPSVYVNVAKYLDWISRATGLPTTRHSPPTSQINSV